MTKRAVEAERRRWLARLYACEGRFDDFCRLIGHKPHSAQREVYASKARRKVVCWGRRTGKSEMAAVLASYCILQGNRRAYIVAPSHELTGRVWRMVKQILFTDLGFSRASGLVSRRDSPPRRLSFSWGSELCGHSTQSEDSRNAMVGEPTDLIVWDECAKSPGSVWELQLQPGQADRSGSALFISKPEGYNHFHDWFLRGCAGGVENWESFQAWCDVNFGNVPGLVEEIEDARRTFADERFRQEWMGEFTTFAGRVYPEFDPLVHARRPLQYDPNLPLVWGFDFGFENPFACLWMQFTPEDELLVIDEYAAKHRTTDENIRAVLAQHQAMGYGPIAWAAADPAGKDARETMRPYLIEHFGIATEHYKYTKGGVDLREIPAGIERIRQLLKYEFEDGTKKFALKPRLYVDAKKCPELCKEFNLYQYPENREDRNAKELPVDMHNHLLAGLRYAVAVWSARIGVSASVPTDLYTQDGSRLKAGYRFKTAREKIAERYGWTQ